MFNLIETVVTKDTPDGAAKVLTALMETCVDRLESLATVLDEVQQRSERHKNEEVESGNFFVVEKARPVASAVYAADDPDNVLSGECTRLHSLIMFAQDDARVPLFIPDLCTRFTSLSWCSEEN